MSDAIKRFSVMTALAVDTEQISRSLHLHLKLLDLYSQCKPSKWPKEPFLQYQLILALLIVTDKARKKDDRFIEFLLPFCC